MITMMYWDTYNGKYVLEKEQTTDKYRYYLTTRGTTEFRSYHEYWIGQSNGKECYLTISYFKDDYESIDAHDIIQKDQFELNDFQPIALRQISIPQEVFDKYVKEYNLEEKNDEQ